MRRLSLVHQVKQCVPSLVSKQWHKGQLGKVGVLGGCLEYTGAPYMSAISAVKTNLYVVLGTVDGQDWIVYLMGADLGYVFCSRDSATAIKSYGPELIVLPVLRTQLESQTDPTSVTCEGATEKIMEWVDRLNVLVIGPGLGRDPNIQEVTKLVIGQCRDKNKPMVIDGDGLWTIEQDPGLIKGYSNVILTPNVNEYSRLCTAVLGRYDKQDTSQLKQLADALGKVTIVRKGERDEISNGDEEAFCDEPGSLRRCGGIGDVLAGCIGCFVSWTTHEQKIKPLPGDPALPPMILAAYGGCLLTRLASADAFKTHKRAMVAHDLLAFIGSNFNATFEEDELHYESKR